MEPVGEVLAEIWRRAWLVQPVPSPTVVAVSALVALGLVVLPLTWPATRQLVTISHEGGHAVAALLTGRRLMGIRLHSDTSGLTVSRGRPTGPGMVIMLAAGYVAPAVAGLGAALLLVNGYALALLWLLVGWLALMCVQIRNAYGLLVLVACGVAIGLASWYLPATWLSAIAYLITWILLVASPRPVLELIRQRRHAPARHSDADQLARLTRIPAGAWIGLFLLLNLAGLVVGVRLLV